MDKEESTERRLRPVAEPDEEPARPDLDKLFVTASAVKPDHVRWLWKKRIPLHEVTLLAGVQGRGKSMLLMFFITGVTTGAFGQRPRDVVLLSAEESPETTIVPRLMAAGADLDRVHIFKISKRFTLPRDIAVLEEAARRWDVGLIVIDPLLSYLGDDTDANSTKEVRRALHALNVVKHKATILALIHFRKESAQEVLHQITSSSAFTEVPRAAMGLGKEPDTEDDDGRLVLCHLKANLYKKQKALLVRIEQVSVPNPDGGPPFETARAVVGDECGYTVEQVFQPSRGGRPSVARDAAKDFILAESGNRPDGLVPVKATRQKFKDSGGSPDTLERARRELGFTSEESQTDGLFYWAPPHF